MLLVVLNYLFVSSHFDQLPHLYQMVDWPEVVKLLPAVLLVVGYHNLWFPDLSDFSRGQGQVDKVQQRREQDRGGDLQVVPIQPVVTKCLPPFDLPEQGLEFGLQR